MSGETLYETTNVSFNAGQLRSNPEAVRVDFRGADAEYVNARDLRDALDEYLDDDEEDAEEPLGRLAEGYQERTKQLSPERTIEVGPVDDDSDEPTGDERARRLLEDVGQLVDSDRDTHGDAVENQEHIASAWTWYLRGKGALDEDEELTGLDVAYMMALLKMSRNAVGEFDIDHPRDVAGYAGIGAACSVARGWADDDELEVADYEDHA